jgi:hypothetical protein
MVVYGVTGDRVQIAKVGLEEAENLPLSTQVVADASLAISGDV